MLVSFMDMGKSCSVQLIRGFAFQHFQVMLQVPFPCYEVLRAAQESYRAEYPDRNYLDDLFAAYDEVGLLQSITETSHKCNELLIRCH